MVWVRPAMETYVALYVLCAFFLFVVTFISSVQVEEFGQKSVVLVWFWKVREKEKRTPKLMMRLLSPAF